MRGFLILFCAGGIFVLTCTSSFSGLVDSGVVRFRWDGDPSLSDLLSPLPARLSRDFLLQKIGHIFAFFILTILLLTKFHSKYFILLMAISYAALTEFLQLFFTRDGRLFDIGFDTIGVLLALMAGSIMNKSQSKQINL